MEELLNKALEGDKNSFSLIFLELQKDMYKIALSKTGNNEDALDAIQETIVITYKNMRKIKSKSSVKYWIIRVLINECYKIHNRQKKSNVVSMQDNKYYETIPYDKVSEINIIDSNIRFYELLNCLNEKQKVIMILYYENQYTTKEISELLKIKENTIKSIIKRAKSKIKKNLKGEEL